MSLRVHSFVGGRSPGRWLPAAALLLVVACGDDRPPFLDAGPSADGALVDGEAQPPDAAADGARPDGPRDLFSPDGASPPPPARPFTVVLLPDTQYYTQSNSGGAIFAAQTAWIVKQLKASQIAFVSHLGDIVQSGAVGASKNKAQWDRAVAAMKALDGDLQKRPDGLLPYAAVVGNHDLDKPSDKTKGATRYLEHFGPGRYKGRSWFVGASANGQNMAQVFDGGGRTYLHLGLEWRPTDEAIAWAQGVLAKHPTLPTIVSTHQYVGKGNPAARMATAETYDSSGVNNGQSLYRKLVVPYPQIFLVLCGHVPGVGRLTSKTALGATVHQVLFDYQYDPKGGNGWLVRVRLDPLTRKLGFSAHSPTYKAGSSSGTDHAKSAASNYTLAFDLPAHRGQLAKARVRRFRQGQDNGAGDYKGARDTYLAEDSPTTNRGTAADVWTDGSPRAQGLLRFEGIIGKGPGKIPPGTKIARAVLTVTTEGKYADSKNGAGLHRMKITWSEGSTWSGLGKGVQLGKEAETVSDASSAGEVSVKGTRSLDVTASVQAWSDGAPNHGWVLHTTGSDRWQLRSSQWKAVAERPMLTVVY